MGHSKIYKNESEFIIANVMDDVENVDAREYFGLVDKIHDGTRINIS